MPFLSCSLFFWLNSHLQHDAILRNPCCSASFSPLLFLLHYPFLISLYLWLNMYFFKDADSVPTFEFPGSTGAGPRQESLVNWIRLHGRSSVHPWNVFPCLRQNPLMFLCGEDSHPKWDHGRKRIDSRRSLRTKLYRFYRSNGGPVDGPCQRLFSSKSSLFRLAKCY